MGSWLGTCGISNLPILAGEPIRAVILTGDKTRLSDLTRDPKTWRPDVELEYIDEAGVGHPYYADGRRIDPASHAAKEANDRWRNSWYGGYCRGEDVFTPRCLPIKGKYDDYGSIEDLDPSLNLQVVLDQFQADLDEYPAGKHDIPGKISKDMTLPELFRAIERGGVTVRVPYSGHVPLGLWMVREDIYQAMLGTVLKGRWGVRDLSADLFRKDAEAYLAGLKSGQGLLPDEFSKLMEFMDSMRSESSRNHVERFAWTSFPIQGARGSYGRWIDKAVRAGSADPANQELKSLILDIADFAFFSLVMDSMRVGWMPQTGAGSQDDRIDAHEAVATQMLKTIAQMRAAWDEDE